MPEDVKEVRIVDIVGLDQQADGGTHVASTSQVGRISVVKVENKGKGFRSASPSSPSARLKPGRCWTPTRCARRWRPVAVTPAGAGGLWTSLDVVAAPGPPTRTCSPAVAPEGQVLVAEEQTAGRGRMGRSWVSQPGASLTFSVLLRPVTVPPARRGWLPLLTGVAVATAVRSSRWRGGDA